MCGTLTKRIKTRRVGKFYPNNEANNEVYLVETARSVAHHAEQVGRPEDGSSREKAEAPAEVVGAVSVEVSADEKTWHQRKVSLVQRLCPISGGGR